MFEALKALLKDNPAALAEIEALEGKVNGKITTLSDEVTAMEGRFNQAKTDNDKSKAKLQLVRSKLGVDGITEDELTTAIAGLSSDEDEKVTALRGEVAQMADDAKSSKTAWESEKAAWESERKSLNIRTQLLGMGADINAVNGFAAKSINRLLMEDAEMEDGVIVYKKDGVTQRISGEKVTPAMRLKQIQDNEETAILFKTKAKGGSGGNNGGSNGGTIGKFSQRRALAG